MIKAARFLSIAFAMTLMLFFAHSVALAGPVWMGPEPVLGVGSTEPPGATTGGPHSVDLILTGPNGHLYWQWLSSPNTYTSPVDLNDVGATSGPSLVANGRNKLDAFYRGANGHLWTSWWDGKWWSAPTDLGGVGLKSAPVAVQGGPHRLDVFYVDDQDRLRNSFWDGGAYWSAPGTFAVSGVDGPVAVVTTGPHRVEVFYRSSNRLWHFWSDGGPWSAAANLGTAISSNPSGASFLNPSRTYASVYYALASGQLCLMASSNRHPWVTECVSQTVGQRIAAVTVDEVFTMGLKTPNGSISNATLRIWRK